MSYKTILVHCDASKSVSHRLDVATDLAQRFGARLVGLHVRRRFETSIFLDGGFAMDDFFNIYDEGVKADETEARAAFTKTTTKGQELTTEWRAVDGYVDSELAVQARYADLVVAGQAGPEPTATPSDLPETVALTTGRPVLVVPFIGAKPRARSCCCAGMPAERPPAQPPMPCLFSRRHKRSSSWSSIQLFRQKATAPNRAPTRPPGSRVTV
jgi:nucleotide-binding universal stress UspA family protein